MCVYRRERGRERGRGDVCQPGGWGYLLGAAAWSVPRGTSGRCPESGRCPLVAAGGNVRGCWRWLLAVSFRGFWYRGGFCWWLLAVMSGAAWSVPRGTSGRLLLVLSGVVGCCRVLGGGGGGLAAGRHPPGWQTCQKFS